MQSGVQSDFELWSTRMRRAMLLWRAQSIRASGYEEEAQTPWKCHPVTG